MEINEPDIIPIYPPNNVVEKYFQELEIRPYHNLEHTQQVLEDALTLATAKNITLEEVRLLTWAVWYHDVGYLDGAQGHEERSCEIAREDLVSKGLNPEEIATVTSLIMATKVHKNADGSVSTSPETDLEKIMCDADLGTVGRTDFYERGLLLRKEWVELDGKTEWQDHQWYALQQSFLNNHQFHTVEAKQLWSAGKEKNQKFITSLIASQ